MAYHITIKDDDGRILTDGESDAIAVAYHGDDGINGHTMIDCDGRTIFHLLLTLDELRDHIMSDNPILRYIYERRDEIIESKIAVDIGTIKRAMQGRDQDE